MTRHSAVLVQLVKLRKPNSSESLILTCLQCSFVWSEEDFDFSNPALPDDHRKVLEVSARSHQSILQQQATHDQYAVEQPQQRCKKLISLPLALCSCQTQLSSLWRPFGMIGLLSLFSQNLMEWDAQFYLVCLFPGLLLLALSDLQTIPPFSCRLMGTSKKWERYRFCKKKRRRWASLLNKIAFTGLHLDSDCIRSSNICMKCVCASRKNDTC